MKISPQWLNNRFEQVEEIFSKFENSTIKSLILRTKKKNNEKKKKNRA